MYSEDKANGLISQFKGIREDLEFMGVEASLSRDLANGIELSWTVAGKGEVSLLGCLSTGTICRVTVIDPAREGIFNNIEIVEDVNLSEFDVFDYT